MTTEWNKQVGSVNTSDLSSRQIPATVSYHEDVHGALHNCFPLDALMMTFTESLQYSTQNEAYVILHFENPLSEKMSASTYGIRRLHNRDHRHLVT